MKLSNLNIDMNSTIKFKRSGGKRKNKKIRKYTNKVKKGGQLNPPNIITKIAGTGEQGYTGDSGLATMATISLGPMGIAVDASNNIFISDMYNHCIRRIDSITGIITTVTANRIEEPENFDLPSQLVVENNGNLLIADSRNHRIRRIDQMGNLTNVIGNGETAYANNLPGDDRLNTQLSYPVGLAKNNTNGAIFISFRRQVMRMDGTTGTMRTIAGGDALYYRYYRSSAGIGDNGPSRFGVLFAPTCLAIDNRGNLFIADPQFNVIRKINTSLVITSVAGNGDGTGTGGFHGDGGPAVLAALNQPCGLAIDSSGNIFIADTGNNRIRRIDAITGIINTVVGIGTGTITSIPDGTPALNAELITPTALTLDRMGNLLICSRYTIYKVNGPFFSPPLPPSPSPSPSTIPASSPRALLAAPNLPRTINRIDEPAGRYRVNLEISRKDTDYNFLQVGIFNSSGQDISSSMKVNNTNNRIIPFTTTPLRFSIGNLIKTGANYLVLNTINSSSRTSNSLFSEVTGRFAFNLNSSAPRPAPATRSSPPTINSPIGNIYNHTLNISWTSSNASGNAVVTIVPPAVRINSQNLLGREGSINYQLPQPFSASSNPNPRLYTITVTTRTSQGEPATSTVTYSQPPGKKK